MVQDRGGAEFKTAGILLYVEDLKRGSNKDIGPKDIFEMGSDIYLGILGKKVLKSLTFLMLHGKPVVRPRSKRSYKRHDA
ncbi:MAG: hypothetical protein OES70_08245, partial [Desulfobacterales bacterium]|nr:hypothetical protein [Desulfobacterales bacterium]